MLEKITKIIRDYKEDGSMTVTETTSFEAMELDSLDVVELMMQLEEAFGVSLEMDEAVRTVGDLMKAITAAQA